MKQPSGKRPASLFGCEQIGYRPDPHPIPPPSRSLCADDAGRCRSPWCKTSRTHVSEGDVPAGPRIQAGAILYFMDQMASCLAMGDVLLEDSCHRGPRHVRGLPMKQPTKRRARWPSWRWLLGKPGGQGGAPPACPGTQR